MDGNNYLLLVDDEALNRDMLSRRLEHHGFRVDVAGDGPSALQSVAAHRPDLVLLDIMMPGMTGVEVLQALRVTYAPNQLPVIMVTALKDSDEVVVALNLGANDYITKPVDFPVAVARIRGQLSRKAADNVLRESEERYALAARGSNDGMWDWDLASGRVYYSERWKAMLGYPDAGVGEGIDEWFSRVQPEELEKLREALRTDRTSVSGGAFECEHRMRHRDGTYRWVRCRGAAVQDGSGHIVRMAGSMSDVTEGKVSDTLTGLANRVLFMDHLEREFNRYRADPTAQFAAMFLDIDRFKLINDSLGHLAGDQLLAAMAERLVRGVRTGDAQARSAARDLPARLGGDEFAVLLCDLSGPAEALQVAQRVLMELREPFALGDRGIFCTVSIGIAPCGPAYLCAADIARDADTAMYTAKGKGRSRCEVFDETMRTRVVERLQLENDLRRAVENHELAVHYQPKVRLADRRICGFEALVRWRHPERGWIPPIEFIPVAEDTGLIHDLDMWILRQACTQMKRWHTQYVCDPPLAISVNLSPSQFAQPNLVEQIADVLKETGIEPSSLRLEITESVLMDDHEIARDILERLKLLGIGLKIDDFGTGYSSLACLSQLPFDTMKIDRSFTMQLQGGDCNSTIVKTILDMAHALGMQVVAEGVEQNEQIAHLISMGCVTVQVDAVARFDVALQVGNVSQEVEVTAAAPLLQSDRADVAQTFDAHQIEELPSVGRNLQAFELLNPGTVPFGWAHASDENPQGSVQMVVNGQVFDAMGYELDGTTNQDPILGIIVINPTFDSVSEVKQANQNFDAEFSYTGGGIASYSTKSGTNDFHGDAFEFLQVNTPGFQDFAENPFTYENPTYRQNQFGGAIGGRIIKDKLFFFGDAQLNRQALGGSLNTSVPSAQDRTGNLGDWLAFSANDQIYDPASGNQTTGVGRVPFAGNVIPTSRLSPQALAIMAYWPLPNTTSNGTSFGNNYDASGDVAITGNLWNTRWDYYLNQKNSIFGRYSYAAYTEQAPGAFGLEAGGPNFGNYAGDSSALNQSLATGWTYTISPTLVNEFRLGYMRYHVTDVPNGFGTDPATTAGIPGLNTNTTYTSGMPYFDIQDAGVGDDKLGYGLGVNQCNCPLTQSERQIQFVDNVTKIHGNHSFKFGADLRYAMNLRVPSDSHRAGELYFNGNNTGTVASVGASPTDGLGLATFLLGDTSSFDRYVSSSTNAQERQKRFFWYGQDEWRVTPKLTATLGVRWEMVFPESVNAPGNGATLDLANGLMYVFGEGGVSSHGIQQMNWHEFAPRVGLAYQIDKKTVVRAGYGWSYNLGTFGSTFGHNVTQNPPVLDYQQSVPLSTQPFASVFSLSQGPSTLAPITVGSNGTFELPNGISPKFRPDVFTMATVYQYNGTVQRQLTNKIAITGGYVGNSTRHGWLGTSNTINPNEAEWNATTQTATQPYYSLYGWTQGLGYYCNCTNQQYNSFQSTLTIKALSGWTVQGNYTYQRLNTWDGPYDTNYYFIYGPQNGAGGQGQSSIMPHDQITIAQNYDIPFGHGQKYGSSANKGVDLVLGGWTVSAITTYYSGIPESPTIDNYGPAVGVVKPGAGPNNRPDMGSGAVYAPTQNRSQWIEGCPDQVCTTGPYAYPASNTFGNYPIDTLIGPHFINFDFAAQKQFHITERVSFGLRMDSRNFFNHTNLGGFNSDVTSPNVGQITGIAFGGNNGVGMRTLQFSGNLKF